MPTTLGLFRFLGSVVLAAVSMVAFPALALDADSDGYSPVTFPRDCDDHDGTVNPNTIEL